MQLKSWLRKNVNYQDDHMEYMGRLGMNRKNIRKTLRYLRDNHYMPYDDVFDVSRELERLNIQFWRSLTDYAIDYSSNTTFPSWVVVDWTATAISLLEDVECIELFDGAFVTFDSNV
jgi:hypothetical protein